MFNTIGYTLLINATISFIRGVIAFNNKKLVITSKFSKILLKGSIPIVLSSTSFKLSCMPILDCAIKDYLGKIGIIGSIDKTKAGYEMYIIEEKDPYYLTKEFINVIKQGQSYCFNFGKRSRIIVRIA